MVRRAVVATRQLAKRQITWLRQESSALWYDPTESSELNFVVGELQKFLEM